MSLPQVPNIFKGLGHYMKIALEHDARDPIIAYWCRFHTVQQGLAIDKSSPEAKQFLFALLDWLEQKKKELKSNEAISSEPTAEAYLEDYILKIFSWADGQDRAGVFNKNVVKAFYTSGILTDILTNFNNGELPDEFKNISKYAKWKAAYIHNCLKKGETPIPGPMADDPDAQEFGFDGAVGGGAQSPHTQWVDPGTGITGSPGLGLGFHQPSEPTPSSSGSNFGAGAGAGTSSNVNMYQNYLPQQPPPSQPEPFLPSPTIPLVNTTISSSSSNVSGSGSTVHLSMGELSKAQKYCKWASSALDYEDTPTAIVNLEKALRLLRTGKDE